MLTGWRRKRRGGVEDGHGGGAAARRKKDAPLPLAAVLGELEGLPVPEELERVPVAVGVRKSLASTARRGPASAGVESSNTRCRAPVRARLRWERGEDDDAGGEYGRGGAAL